MDNGRIRGRVDSSQALVAGGGVMAPAKMAGRRERRAAETRLRLFRCALQLIAERGLDGVTIEDITEAADVGKGTFFNYFGTKEHVLGVMSEIQLEKLKKAGLQAAQDRQSTYAVLHRLVAQLAEEPGRSPRLARALISSFLASPSVREIVKRAMREGRGTVAALVADGQARGEIDPRLKKEKVAIQFLQSVIGTVLLWSLHEKPRLESWIEDSFQHFWRSVAVAGTKQVR